MMVTPSFALEQQVAIAAVRRACTLTANVFNKLVASEKAIKDDNSPVTVADYAAQAVINIILSRAFPFDPIVGEEDSADLQTNTALRDRVVELASEVLAQPPRSFYLDSSSSSSSSSDSSDSSDSSYFWEDSGRGRGSGESMMMDGNESAEWGLGRRWTADSLLEAIDRGKYPGGRSGRMWTLDPIDGTKGFLKGRQYAVCLALLVDARVELGVIGCPNLLVNVATTAPTTTTSSNSSILSPSSPPQPASASTSSAPPPATTATTTTHKPEQEQEQVKPEKGALFVAVRGQGAYQLPLSLPDFPPLPNPQMTAMQLQEQWQQRRVPLSMPPNIALPNLSFLESVEKEHAALDTNQRIAERLGVRPPVRMDSQAKYAALVRGDSGAGVYLRLPVAGKNYQEKIWDHAPGSLLVQEAGGIISDLKGRPLDFGLGRTLGENFGVVAARKDVHAKVIEAIQAVLSSEEGGGPNPDGEKSAET